MRLGGSAAVAAGAAAVAGGDAGTVAADAAAAAAGDAADAVRPETAPGDDRWDYSYSPLHHGSAP